MGSFIACLVDATALRLFPVHFTKTLSLPITILKVDDLVHEVGVECHLSVFDACGQRVAEERHKMCLGLCLERAECVFGEVVDGVGALCRHLRQNFTANAVKCFSAAHQTVVRLLLLDLNDGGRTALAQRSASRQRLVVFVQLWRLWRHRLGQLASRARFPKFDSDTRDFSIELT